MKTIPKVLIAISLLYFTACEKAEESKLHSEQILQSHTNAVTPGEWTRMPDYPCKPATGVSTAEGFIGFHMAGKIYVGDSGTFFYEFDPLSKTWTKKADVPALFYGRVSFSIGNYGYIGLGRSFASLTSQFFKYNPLTNKWSNMADYPGSPSDESIAFTIGDKGYVLGGEAPNKTAFYEYNPDTDVWTKKADYPVEAVRHPVGFSIGTKGYAGTGYTSSTPGTYTNEFYEYDPAADTWTKKASFAGGPRYWPVGFSIGNKGYIGTGLSHESEVTPFIKHKDFWEYDPTANTWALKAPFGGSARYGALGVAVGDKAYVGFGLSDVRFARDLWEFDPSK